MSALTQLAWTQFWQTSVVALAAGAVAWTACRRRPHLAYLLWIVVILKCLTPPVWSSPTGLFSWAMVTRSATESLDAPSAVTAANVGPVLPVASSAPSPTPQSVDLPQVVSAHRHRPAKRRPAFNLGNRLAQRRVGVCGICGPEFSAHLLAATTFGSAARPRMAG